MLSLVAMSLFVFLLKQEHDRAAETQCKNNLRQLGLGLWNYSEVYSGFPPAHKSQHSWRIRLLPFILSSPQYTAYDFNQPWDAPHNMVHTRPLRSGKGHDEAMRNRVSVWGHPYGPPCDHADPDTTSYVMLVGKDAFAHPSDQRDMADITDGLKNTIAIVEVADSTVHWLSPVDLDFDDMSFKINDGSKSISSHHPTGPAVLFCDRVVLRLNPAISPEIVRGLCTINGGEDLSRDALIEQGLLIR